MVTITFRPRSQTGKLRYDHERFLRQMKEAIEILKNRHGRIDPTWGEVNRLVRGDVDLPIAGGHDVLRAIYGDIKIAIDSFQDFMGRIAFEKQLHRPPGQVKLDGVIGAIAPDGAAPQPDGGAQAPVADAANVGAPPVSTSTAAPPTTTPFDPRLDESSAGVRWWRCTVMRG